MAKSYYEGRPCPECGAQLRVIAADESLVGSFEGEDVIASTYQCEGEERHTWEDRATPYEGRVARMQLRGPLGEGDP